MENLILGGWDYAALGIYVGLILLITILSLWFSNRGTKEGYFLASRNVTWIGVGVSLFASSLSMERILFLTGGGASIGLAAAATEVLAMPFLLVLGWVFAPVYIASNVLSLPQYIHRRFGGQRLRILLVIIYLVLYVGVRLSVNLYASAIFLHSMFPDWSVYAVIVPMLILVALYTVTGGLRAVINTQILQTILIIAGSAILAAYAYMEVGGYIGLIEKYFSPQSVSNDSFVKLNMTCGHPKADALYLLRDARQSDMPWAAFLFCYSSNILWMWCADQVIVQKTLAAKTLSHAQGGCLLAGYLKILPMFLLVIPGMISRTLYTNTVACATEDQCLAMCGNPSGCSHIALPKLIMTLLPTGLHGVLLVVMLSAAMADLSSVFNSASTLITVDIAGALNKHLMDRWTMASGRIATIIMVIICFAWLPVVNGGAAVSDVFASILKVQFGFAPPIAAVFLLAMVWPRANEKGSFFALLVGVVLGIAHTVCSIVFPEPMCGHEDKRPVIFKLVHPFYVTLIIFVVTVIVDIVISLCTCEPNDDLLLRTTYWRRNSSAKPRTKKAEEESSMKHKFLIEEDAWDEEFTHWREKSKMQLCYEWFCGYGSYDVSPKRKQTRAVVVKTTESQTVGIKQKPCAKIILNFNLVIVLLIAIAMFAFFSIPSQILMS